MAMIQERYEILKEFDRYYLENSDPRTRELWLMGSSPMQVWIITYAYFAFIYCGSSMMAVRRAFHLNRLMFVYNTTMAVFSGYMLCEIMLSAYEANYPLWGCVNYNKDTVDNPYEARMARVLWCYFLSKAVELFDTVFMVLRKKNSQITFLHVFHHASMVNIWWYVAMFMPGGLAYFGPMLNCFIHVLMYSYYGLSAVPRLHGKLWWKRYITRLQLMQFALVLIHTIGSLIYPCDFPACGQYILAGYTLVLLCLFVNFYLKAYVVKRKLTKNTDENK